MKIKPFRIPTHISLPGILIRVDRAPREGSVLEGDNAAWIYDNPDGEARVILAQDIKEVAQLRWLIYHELPHIGNDMQLVALRDYPDLFKVPK